MNFLLLMKVNRLVKHPPTAPAPQLFGHSGGGHISSGSTHRTGTLISGPGGPWLDKRTPRSDVSS